MPAASISLDEDQEKLSELLIDAINRRRVSKGVAEPIARAEVAREARIPPGTAENIKRKRTKGATFRDRIINFVIRDLQREIARLEHDLELALRCARRPDEAAVLEARAALARARELIEGGAT